MDSIDGCVYSDWSAAGFPISATADLGIQQSFFTTGNFLLSAVSIGCTENAQNISQCFVFVEEEIDVSDLAGVRCIGECC